MLPVRSVVRTWSALLLFGAAACSGSVSCGGCGGGLLAPIPGGFDPAAQIERAAQVRLSTHGLDFIESKFADLLGAYASMECGSLDAVPCPTGFVTVPGGAANPSTCDAATLECVEAATGAPGPLMGFEIERTEQSGATICRDDLADPNRRRCYAWLRFEGLTLQPQGPDQVIATISTQIQSSDLPLRYDALGMDCIVSINSAASGSALQDLVATARLTEWTPPSGSGGRQLKLAIDSVDAQIPDEDIRIARDPVHGTLADAIVCGIANLGVVKNILVPRLTGSLADLVDEQVASALAMQCDDPTVQCPAGTHCNGDLLCEEDATGEIVPTRLGTEGRADFSSLLGGLTAGRPGQGDVSFLVGGQSGTDAQGLAIGVLGGAETVTPDPSCAVVSASPRLRPGWITPPALPAVDTVDLDFDGTAETAYMVAAGISDALLDQVIWTIYTTGLFCQSVSGYDIELLNTGSLGLLVPSLAQLTHSDRFSDAIYPARVTVHPGREPEVILGPGKIDRSGATPVLEEPLIRLVLRDMQLDFFAMVEERWIRLMTITVDLDVGLGVDVTPSNELVPVLGDLSGALTNVRVTNSEILAEDPAELALAIPSLLQLALPQLAGVLPGFPLPGGSELGGFGLEVLGIRGVEAAPGVFPNFAIYANLSFDPSLVPNLSLSVETEARVAAVRLPEPRRFAVSAEGGPTVPEVELAVTGHAPAGKPLEAQLRIDGGLWTPFHRLDRPTISVRRSELLAQGRHRIEVRARVEGEYKTLDATPAIVDVVIDAEPPRLSARVSSARGGVVVDAYDVVSKDALRLELVIGAVARELRPDAEGFVAVPELSAPADAAIVVAATDEAGLRSEVVVRRARSSLGGDAQPSAELASSGGCVCVDGASGASSTWLFALVGLVLVLRHRRVR
ncbi:hypothetical protein L6R52_13450 [Myxococcota bacterium]|nr:hypothetical protein [Myxococcota bacterium]